MTALFEGMKVKIPRGYSPTENGTYMNGHGVEYALVSYGWKADQVICLETVNGYRHTRTIELEIVEDKPECDDDISKLVKASVFVQKMKRKYGANPVWVWDLIEDMYNYIKGHGHLLNQSEMREIEEFVIDGLSENSKLWPNV